MKKILLFILLAAIFLSGCSAKQDSVATDTSVISEQPSKAASSQNESSTDTASVVSDIKSSIPISHTIKNFEIIGQLPELPTGCEITSLTMVLNYYGLNPDKMEMATKYLPKTEYSTYYKNGRLMGPDLDNYFLGDPTSVYGYVCGTDAIISAANAFLSDINSKYKAADLKGCDISELYKYVSQDSPVAVWTTIEIADRYETEGWYTESGKYVEWSQNDHCNVLIGYTENTVTIADPILGEVEYDKKQFEKVFKSRGSKAVILK